MPFCIPECTLFFATASSIIICQQCRWRSRNSLASAAEQPSCAAHIHISARSRSNNFEICCESSGVHALRATHRRRQEVDEAATVTCVKVKSSACWRVWGETISSLTLIQCGWCVYWMSVLGGMPLFSAHAARTRLRNLSG